MSSPIATATATSPAAATPQEPLLDVLVRGVGIVGNTLALALAQGGLRVALQGDAMRSNGKGDDVRAYAINAASVALLEQVGAWQALPSDAKTAIADMQVEGDGGPSATLHFSAWQQSVRELGWIVDAGALEVALQERVDGMTSETSAGSGRIQRLSESADECRAALMVVAEGKASSTRDQLGVRFERRPYGQHAVAARLVASLPHHQTARQWFKSPDILALLPFDRPSVGNSYGLVWSVAPQRASELLAMSDADFEVALNEATEGAAGQLQLRSKRASWPLAMAQADRVAGSGWALVGDAAHLVHPLAGQGLNLGLGDVQSLIRVIDARESWRSVGDERLLQRYARERSLAVKSMSLTTDGLQLLFAHPSALARELRNRGMGLLEHLSPLKRLLAREAFGRDHGASRTKVE